MHPPARIRGAAPRAARRGQHRAGPDAPGTRKADRIDGSSSADRIFGRGGRDLLRGLGGRDLIDGGVVVSGGTDVVDCGAGLDRVTKDRSDRVVHCESIG